MFKLITKAVFVFLFLAGTASTVTMAQENQPVTASLVKENANVVPTEAKSEMQGELANRTGMQQLPQTMMSPVETSVSVPGMSSELVEQAGNTAMAAGSCSVVDLFVRQYCASNPNDISCQFQ